MASIIVSRFNEDLSWLLKIKGFNIVVYNKGESLDPNNQFKIIKLKNTYEKPSEKKKRILQENIKRVKKLNKLKNRI